MTFTALLLGAYGHVGRQAISGLSRMNCIDTIIASGRNKDKLESIISGMVPDGYREKITTKSFDAFDSTILQDACKGVDLVINCMGPFTNDQGRVAAIVITNGTNYIDIANEQSQYRSLLKLDEEAKQKDVVLITGAGTSPGISTLLFMLGASKLQDPVVSMDMFYASGRHPTENEAFGSTMGALLEASIGSKALKDGNLVNVALGKKYRTTVMPGPFGKVKMVEFPTADALIMQAAFHDAALKNVGAFWAMGDIPFGLSTLLKLLKPHKRKWANDFFAGIVRSTMAAEFKKLQEQGIGTEAVMKVIVAGLNDDDTWEATLTFPRGGGEAAHYIPLIYAGMIATGQFEKRGLVTPADGDIEPMMLQKYMNEHGWTGTFTESGGQ